MSDRAETLVIETRTAAHHPVIALAGDLDLGSAPGLRSTLLDLLQRNPQRVIFDLARLNYMDSSGIGTMVDFKRRLERNGGRIILTGLPDRIRSLLEITQLHKFFTICGTVEEAVEA